VEDNSYANGFILKIEKESAAIFGAYLDAIRNSLQKPIEGLSLRSLFAS
jgi:hypothetical protein